MICDILIVTYKRDFPYLFWCLKSIEKFARGFNRVRILIPSQDLDALVEDSKNFTPALNELVRIQVGYEWPEKGMLWHMAQIMHSDQLCPTADFICHIDSDCIFTAPVTPATFIKNGKPILQYERFESIGLRHPGVVEWQKVTQNCLPFDIHFETMRGHPECYHRANYAEARKLIKQKTGQECDDYIRAQKNDFPNGFCEFVTLGNVAMHCFSDKYCLVDNALKPNPERSDFPLAQFWSHSPLDKPQHIWWNGEQKMITPIDEIKKVLS